MLKVEEAKRFGRIINISSTAGRSVSTIGGCHYTVSKAGLLGLTRALASEISKHNITVNAICPGMVVTDMVKLNTPEEDLEKYRVSIPSKKLGST